MAKMVTGFLLAIVAYLGTALFLHFAYIRYFWLMAALAAASARIVRGMVAARQGFVAPEPLSAGALEGTAP
jgi:hypothetical protein